MKKAICLLLLGLFCMVALVGCDVAQGDAEQDLQRLAQAEIYSGDGNLIYTVTDADTLKQLNQIPFADLSSNLDSAVDWEKETEGLCVQYTVILYKTPAAMLNDGTLEKLMELTVYEDSNLIKEQIAPENIKSVPISEELLTFYVTLSDEEKELLLSLVKV